MRSELPVTPTTLRGLARLSLDATARLTDIVEGMHLNIAQAPLPWAKAAQGHTRGITGLVYRSIRGGMVGASVGLHKTLSLLEYFVDAPHEPFSDSTAQLAFRAALNGVVGDHLANTGNPLALPMRFLHQGQPLVLRTEALRSTVPQASGRLLVLVHGLCMSPQQWQRKGHDHGAALAAEFGYTPLYLQYNSGCHISINGREFAEQLESLLAAWPTPVRELTLLTHSLGGLVSRSALHYAAAAQHRWPKHLRKLAFLGTPHHGAPLERGGNWFQAAVGFSPYTAPLARLGMLRSAGVTDLRHGNLLDEDWQAQDRFEVHDDTRQPVPLPAGLSCYAVAATTGKASGDLKDRVLGDGLVPVKSALGIHPSAEKSLAIPPERQRLFFGTHHLDLLNKPEIYAQLRDWLA